MNGSQCTAKDWGEWMIRVADAEGAFSSDHAFGAMDNYPGEADQIRAAFTTLQAANLSLRVASLEEQVVALEGALS